MPKRQTFYSFHYDNDVFRVQQIRNIGVLEDNKPVSENDWETVKRGGDTAIQTWINENMKNRTCVIVLIGSDTARRKWVQYEIRKAWNDGKGLFGIYIHNINCIKNGKCNMGSNPFEQITLSDGKKLSSIIKCYNPSANDAYNDIKNNMENWVEDAINSRK